MEEFALLQDKTSRTYYVALASAVKSRENLELIKKYTDREEAIDDLVAFSTGEKDGSVGARLTLKDVVEDILPGGRADKLSPQDFDATQLKIGTRHEFEHTKNKDLAREIAMDHLSEDPNYYKKLAKVER